MPAPTPPNAPTSQPPPRGRFPWSLIVVPLLIAIGIYVSVNIHPASADEASLRLGVQQFIQDALPGASRAEVTIASIDYYRESANVAGTALGTDFSGVKKHYDWHMTLNRSSGEWKATEWKVAPQDGGAH